MARSSTLTRTHTPGLATSGEFALRTGLVNKWRVSKRFQYGDGIEAVPGSPKPKRDVRVVLTVPFQWASCQYWNRHRSAKPQMWVRFPPRSPISRWGGSSTGLERRIPKPKGGSSSLPCPTKRFQWEFVKQTTIALSMAL